MKRELIVNGNSTMTFIDTNYFKLSQATKYLGVKRGQIMNYLTKNKIVTLHDKKNINFGPRIKDYDIEGLSCILKINKVYSNKTTIEFYIHKDLIKEFKKYENIIKEIKEQHTTLDYLGGK